MATETSPIPAHFKPDFRPIPAEDAVLTFSTIRITVLADRVIRLEYAPDGRFEDRPSQVFWYREQPVPNFTSDVAEGRCRLETAHLLLAFEIDRWQSITVTLKAENIRWRIGDEDAHNLLGTARTLDEVSGATMLEPGLLSRSGWTVVDDSETLVFGADGWLQPRTAAPGARDLYFFGFGHAYQACLDAYRRLTGPAPMIPRYMLGNWWSRYWAYTHTELAAVVQGFREHNIPLSVCIIDMDWHVVDNPTSSGWTGYTWNRKLFPEPTAFIRWLHDQGLRTALNLHPAQGVHPHEAAYPALADAMGVDPASAEPIPFDIADPAFAQAYFELLHHPEEARGVDFWWIDWQQGEESGLHGLDPLWWLNHLHFLDHGRDGVRRPVIFSRWGGLGNHRYPIGFSGDTWVDWESLAFQPYFTATAANVCYDWWSHDIGGHMFGQEEGELYVRWVQFGVFSPILRLHSTNNPFHERRPWAYPASFAQAAGSALRLRHRLIPYLYALAWRDHRDGIAPVRPLYHTHPTLDVAYAQPQTYWFGDLVVSPVVARGDVSTGTSQQTVWLPPGQWYDFFTGERFDGGRQHRIDAALEEVPVFAPAGAVIPLAPEVGWGGVEPPATLAWHIFSGSDGAFTLYEDDGETTSYLNGDYALTNVTQLLTESGLEINVSAVSGVAAHVPARRQHQFVVYGVDGAAKVLAMRGKRHVPVSTRFDPINECLVVTGIVLAPEESARVVVVSTPPTPRDRRSEALHTHLSRFTMPTQAKRELWEKRAELLGGADGRTRLLDAYAAALSAAQRAVLENALGRRSSAAPDP